MMRQRKPERPYYPVMPRLVLLEQPWLLARDNWSADDPTETRGMFERLLAYANEMGIPIFSCHSSRSDFPGQDSFARQNGIMPVNIRAISSGGFLLEDALDRDSFISRLMDGPEGPVIVGGAHARTTEASGFGRMMEAVGFRDRIIDGICILEPLRFLLALREAGMLESRVILDPRVTIQIGGPRLDGQRLYEVIGQLEEPDSFRVRPSLAL